MDEKTLAFINLRAILGSIPLLCELDENAAKLIRKKNVSIGFTVKNGPEGALVFKDGKCEFTDSAEDCSIKLPFASPKKFNGMIDGTVTPIPSKGFTKIGFLLKNFTRLTDILTAYLRPETEKLQDEKFFTDSTVLMFHLIVEALAQVGNLDKVSRTSAGYITDGAVKLAIEGGPAAYIACKDHVLTAVHEDPKEFTSYMVFSDIHTARDLFDGKVNAVASIGLGKVRIGGMISQVDNINRILDRVGQYLA